MEKGYVIVRQAFSRETADGLAAQIWKMLPEDPADKTTWNRHAAEIREVVKEGPVSSIFTGRYEGAVDELLGSGRWYTNRDSFGWIPVRFPGFAHSPWHAPGTGWHIDGINFQHYLTSAETALAGMEFFSDIAPGGGGTALRVGSHKYIAGLLKERESTGISYKELVEIAQGATEFAVEEATGEAGDVLWMHPFLIHARSPNVTDDVRIAANRTISLYVKSDPWRSDPAELSLLELSIKNALL